MNLCFIWVLYPFPLSGDSLSLSHFDHPGLEKLFWSKFHQTNSFSINWEFWSKKAFCQNIFYQLLSYKVLLMPYWHTSGPPILSFQEECCSTWSKQYQVACPIQPLSFWGYQPATISWVGAHPFIPAPCLLIAHRLQIFIRSPIMLDAMQT